MADYFRGKQVKRDKNIVTGVLITSTVIMFSVFILRLFLMQVVKGSDYKIASTEITTRLTVIPAQRGEIYDRNNNSPLVINTDSFSVLMNPGEIPEGDYDTVAAKLADFLGIKKAAIDKIIPEKERTKFKIHQIKKNVPFSIVSNIAENINDLPGVKWVNKPLRNYIESNSFSHILGYVGIMYENEYFLLSNKGYKRNTIIGKTGIEKQYDELLQGKDGYESRFVDSHGRYLNTEPQIVPPEMGKKLVLTIDARVQTLAEKALGERSGSIVVLKPTTGEVLAMVSYPYYNSNIFNSENLSEEYSKLLSNDAQPLMNRSIAATYPPASTFKIVMETGLLNEGKFSRYEKIECKGEMEYGGQPFHCWEPKPGHGKLNLRQALGHSCDIYFWIAGRDHLGITKITEYARMFGYGQKTGIDLPGEEEGLFPKDYPVYWERLPSHRTWLDGDTMAVSIGQGATTATPLQVANVMAMVVNEGTIYKPHILKEVRDPNDNSIIKEIKPEVLYHNDINHSVWKEVKESLRYVTTDGTAKYALRNPSVIIAAKTGTAEVTGFKDSWHSWLLSYAPYDGNPDDMIVVSAIVEARNAWQWWATWATNIVMQGYFANQTFDEAVDALGLRWLVNQPITRAVGGRVD